MENLDNKAILICQRQSCKGAKLDFLQIKRFEKYSLQKYVCNKCKKIYWYKTVYNDGENDET